MATSTMTAFSNTFDYPTNCDFAFDVNSNYCGSQDNTDLSHLAYFEPYTCDAESSLSDPDIADVINLILPSYIDFNESQSLHQPNCHMTDSESDTDSVMISSDDVRDLTCGHPHDYLDNVSDSSVSSGQFDCYQPQIPSPVYPACHQQSLPSFNDLIKSTTIRTPNRPMYPLPSDDDDEESEAIIKKGKRGAKNVLLWKFLLDELSNSHQKHIRWISCKEGTFRFVDTAEISKMWGAKKRKNDMNFEKLSRGIRHYYKSGFMRREDGTRLVYQFNWKKVPKEYRRRFQL